MKDKKLFNRLIIFLGVVAILGYCIIPAFAQEMMDPNRAQVASEYDSMPATPLEDPELLYDSFGDKIQRSWIGFSSFVPVSSDTTWSQTNGYIYSKGGTDREFVASIHLPSGAFLYNAQLFYYDNTSALTSNTTANLYRYSPYTSIKSLGTCSSSGAPGYSYCQINANETIQNGNSFYTVHVVLGVGTTNLRFTGVRLAWKRQIRTGLSHPFTDIGSLPSAFQDAIAALYRSGITSGTSATTYGPNNPVTRAQMAVFLSKALGLYWDYPY